MPADMFDDEFDGYYVTDTKTLLVEDHIFEEKMAEDNTVTLTTREMDTLYYACAQAEMMWRFRSQHPEMFTYRIGGEQVYTEEECRSEMKKYREMQKAFSDLMPKSW